ncbi:MAG: hypothetical protein ACTSPI_09450 [Candidatus Heimdallarchaeaceae archaeon]
MRNGELTHAKFAFWKSVILDDKIFIELVDEIPKTEFESQMWIGLEELLQLIDGDDN